MADRVDIAPGGFFDAVSPGGHVYVLSQVLHDWDDEHCRLILVNIRRAILPDGRLLIFEIVMPDHIVGPHPAVTLDLIMLVLTGGRERTLAEYRALLERAGFALHHVVPNLAPGALALLEARPT